MSDKDDGGAAFPKAGLDPWGAAKSLNTGMTLRDYFAAKAMHGMVCSIQCDDDYYRARSIVEQKGLSNISEWFAEDAYKQADAMLKERAK